MIIGGNAGTVSGNVNHSAGTISPGAADGSIGILTFHDNLAVNGGAFVMDLKGGLATPQAGTDGDLVNVLGQLDLNSGTVLANFTSTPTAGATYTLLTYGSETATSSTSNISLGIRANAVISDDHSGHVTLQITNTLPSANLSWNGNLGNTWDVAGTANWRNGIASDKFFNLDTVTFDDTASNYTVTINSYAVNPNGLVFNNNNNDYTISGSGTISGATSLIMNGSRMLTLNNQNNYLGGTVLNAGTIGFTSAQPFTGTVTFAGGQLAAIQPNATPNVAGNTYAWNGATLSVAAGRVGTINLVANNNFGSTVVGSNGVQLFQQSLTAGGTLTGGGNVVFVTSNIAPQPPNSTLIVPGVTPIVDEVTDVNTNASAFTGTISFINSGQYAATDTQAGVIGTNDPPGQHDELSDGAV